MISVEEFLERLCRMCGERPRPLPRRRQDREILFKSILMQLDSSRTYTEPEVNEILQAWNEQVAPAIETDHVTLRRMLVDQGQLERTANGDSYRVGFPTRPPAFDLEIDDLDLPPTIAAYRTAFTHRRKNRKNRGKNRGRS